MITLSLRVFDHSTIVIDLGALFSGLRPAHVQRRREHFSPFTGGHYKQLKVNAPRYLGALPTIRPSLQPTFAFSSWRLSCSCSATFDVCGSTLVSSSTYSLALFLVVKRWLPLRLLLLQLNLSRLSRFLNPPCLLSTPRLLAPRGRSYAFLVCGFWRQTLEKRLLTVRHSRL